MSVAQNVSRYSVSFFARVYHNQPVENMIGSQYRAMSVCVIILISPASAQQADPSIRQSAERIAAAYMENFNKHNASGIAGLYTADGVLVVQSPTGAVKSGPQASCQF